jgi:hypothetical protein
MDEIGVSAIKYMFKGLPEWHRTKRGQKTTTWALLTCPGRPSVYTSFFNPMLFAYTFGAMAIKDRDLMPPPTQRAGQPMGVELGTAYLLWYVLVNDIQDAHPCFAPYPFKRRSYKLFTKAYF